MLCVGNILRISAVFAAFAAGPVSAEPVGVSYSEFPVENAALIAATQAFFDEVEAGLDVPNSRSRPPVIGLALRATRASATVPAPQGEGGVLTRMGPVRHLTGYNITWYPMDKLLGSVDYMGTWNGNRNLVCGYLTWDLSQPEAPRLVAVEANYVDLDDLKTRTPVEIHRTLLTANCAFGAVDENYAFFDVAG